MRAIHKHNYNVTYVVWSPSYHFSHHTISVRTCMQALLCYNVFRFKGLQKKKKKNHRQKQKTKTTFKTLNTKS